MAQPMTAAVAKKSGGVSVYCCDCWSGSGDYCTDIATTFTACDGYVYRKKNNQSAVR